VNAETIRQLREMAGEDGYTQIRAEFLSATARSLAEMARAAEAGDVETLRRRLHALKGASGSLGAGPLEALCREAEKTIADAARAERLAAVARLAAEFESVRRELGRDA
jgi:HPt (histidine-containing phosphotransfer) domain-containing protein